MKSKQYILIVMIFSIAVNVYYWIGIRESYAKQEVIKSESFIRGKNILKLRDRAFFKLSLLAIKSDGKKIELDELEKLAESCKNKRLVLRFTDRDDEKNVLDLIKYLNTHFDSEMRAKMIILSNNQNMIERVKFLVDFEYDYFLTKSLEPVLPIDNGNRPYFFMLDEQQKVSKVMVPDMAFPELMSHYFEEVQVCFS